MGGSGAAYSSRGPSPLPSLYEGRHGHGSDEEGGKEWYDEAFEREHVPPLPPIPSDHRFSSGSLASGILGIIATVGWTLQGVGLAWYYRNVRIRRSPDAYATLNLTSGSCAPGVENSSRLSS